MQWKNPDGSITEGIVIEDGAGKKLGTAANPLNVTGGSGGGGSNASVGSTGAAVPSSATAVGFQNAAGNLVLPTPSAGLPVADSGAAITGANLPAGGVGLTGWLSAIWSKLGGAALETGGNLASIAASVSTAANQLTANTTLSSILTKLGAVVLSAGSAIIGKVGIDQTTAGVTNGVVVNSSALPAGAATSALQSAMTTALGSPAQDGTDATGVTQLSGGVGIRGWLSGIYAKLAGTLAISATSLPLPTGAATATLQSAAQSAPGTPQTVALTVQGNASGIAVPTVETYANISGVSPVSVGQSPTLIVAARAGRKEVTLILEAAVAVRIGGSSVASATNGALLQGVLGEAITISGGAAIYGYAPTGTASVSALEVY
jgi:hypothetical protein